jgi:four helix bundle protein
MMNEGMMNEGRACASGQAKGDDLKRCTKAFALRIIRLYGALPKSSVEAQVIGKQLLRSGTSVGAHYREASRARSPREFVSKLEGGLRELEETVYWLELLVEAGIVSTAKMAGILPEANELLAILIASAKTAKSRL